MVNSSFDRLYLDQVNSPVLRADKHWFVYQTKQANLKYTEGGTEVLKAVIALMGSLKSGKVQDAFSKSRINR